VTVSDRRTAMSGTSRVSIHTTRIMSRTLHLIDTPGFDDSERSDIDTLQELAYWLAAAYERGMRLHGIIYLHRISDTRLQGSALRSLNALKAMCGQAALGGVVLATTMWDTIPLESVTNAVKRQDELQNRVCHDILKGGGRIVALSAAEIDGTKILQHIVQRNIQLTLLFQQQMMIEKMLVHETDMGKILLGNTSRSFESLQSATDGSLETMTVLVSAGHLRDAEDADDAVKEMTRGTQTLERDLELAQMTLADIRQKWEGNLSRDDVALEEALHANEKDLQQRHVSLPANNQSELSGHVSERRQGTIEYSDMADSTSLIHERQAIMATMNTRLHRRHTPYNRISPRVSIIGTGLALGQLVATLACSVM